MCKHSVKRLSFVIRHIPYQYKLQEMYNKAVIENG